MNDSRHAFATFDAASRDHIAHALWMTEFDAASIPADITSALLSPKNSPAARGERMRQYLRYLIDHPLSRTPDQRAIYKRLLPYCRELSPQQAYVIQSAFLGPPATVGYDIVPERAGLEFPRDHLPKPRSRNGWHFFVGSCWDTDGNEYGVELMFFQAALFPPHVAAGFGLSDDENQVVELQFAISEAGGRHYQAEPVVLGGTSGLVRRQADPFVYRLGRNTIECHQSGGFFPVTIRGWGIDRGSSPARQLGAEITFVSGKETLLQGADGCMPSIDGIGSLYYSIPNLVVDPSSSWIELDGRRIPLARGTFWFDHQWGYLGGVGHSSVLRAATFASTPNPVGWDWFMAHFMGDRQLTVFAPHTRAFAAFYEQSEPEPPGTMSVRVAGTYMDAERKTSIVRGALDVTGWIRAEHSPNPERYAVTRTWYPNRWEFRFAEGVPSEIARFAMEPIVGVAQSGFFANGAQYAEGAVVLRGPAGEDFGRGFAESVAFADTRKTMHRLAGLPDSDADVRAMRRKVPLGLRLRNAAYVLAHRKELEAIAKASAGMEFFVGERKARPGGGLRRWLRQARGG